MKLPLPLVYQVKEVYDFHNPHALDHIGKFVMVCPDPSAGRRNRYSVISIDYQTGQAETIGRELPLAHARRIAKTHRVAVCYLASGSCINHGACNANDGCMYTPPPPVVAKLNRRKR